MRLPEHERQAHKDAFRAMNLAQKAEYVFAYYKLPLVLALIVLVALGSVLRYALTHKQPLLYAGMANVSVAEENAPQLTEGFVSAQGADQRTHEIVLYRDLYLVDPEDSADHQLSYASRLKVMAAIDAQELDVVLMSKQSYDLLSHSGYLMDLSTITSELSPEARDLMRTNDVIVSDNEVEYQLGEAEEYEAETKPVTNAIEVSGHGPFVGLTDSVYLGIIGNTPRLDAALAYVAYLM